MIDLVFIGVHVLGLVGLVAGYFAFRRNGRDVAASRLSLLVWRVALLVGVALAILSLLARYPLDATRRIVGFPFMAAAWEKRGDHWQDFVGPLTLPAYAANAAFAFMLPQLLLRIRSRPERR